MIRFEHVYFKHKDGPLVLEDICFEARSGEVIALVGRNGAGKTTLIKHMNGLLKPTKGSVIVFGQDTVSLSVSQLSRRVGVVFQNPDHQLFSESVLKEVEFGPRNFKIEGEELSSRVKRALEGFWLEKYANQSPLCLSGGEKKSLCIASVLSWDPDVLVLDEPTLGQDSLHRDRLSSMINELSKRGKIVIVTSHDMDFVWGLKPRIIAMSSGRIIADGPATDVLSDEDVISEAGLIRPQLLELYMGLKKRPKDCFYSAKEAIGWISSVFLEANS